MSSDISACASSAAVDAADPGALTKEHSSVVSDTDSELNLLVAGLTREIDDLRLRRMFEPFGEVRSAIVMLKANTATSRGFGFVLFARRDDAVAAMEALNNTKIGPNTLNIRPSTHDGHVEERDAIFVRNIPKEIPAAHVQATLEAAIGGPVASVTPMPGSTSSVSNATVILTSVDDARRAVATLHGQLFAALYERVPHLPPVPPAPEGRPAVPAMLVKFAEPDESRRKRYIKTRLDRQHRVNDSQSANTPPPASSDARAHPTRTATRSGPQHHYAHHQQQNHYHHHHPPAHSSLGGHIVTAPPVVSPSPYAFQHQTAPVAYPFVAPPSVPLTFHHNAPMLPAATTLHMALPLPFVPMSYGMLPAPPAGCTVAAAHIPPPPPVLQPPSSSSGGSVYTIVHPAP